MRSTVFLAAVMFVLATVPAAGEPARAAARGVQVGPLEGLPADSVAAAEFRAGFAEAFAAPELALERADGAGGWLAAGMAANRFAEAGDSRAEDLWSLQVSVGAPPPYSATRRNPRTGKRERWVSPDLRASRGMTVTLFALSPEAIAAGVRAMPDRYGFVFPPAVAPARTMNASGMSGGFKYPWREAGRATARLALELLHRRAGDLTERERLALDPARRAALEH